MKIFLSYSRKDHNHRDEILKILSKLEEDHKIKLWVDYRETNGGDLFDEKIEKEIETSDVFLLLLSQDFWDSEYIQIYELPDILSSFRKKKIKIVPIILKDKNDYIGKVQLQKFSAIPQDKDGLKPINMFASKKDGYKLIREEVKKIVSAQDIGNNMDLLHLCRESMGILNPYNDFVELEVLKRQFNSKDKSFQLEFKKIHKKSENIIKETICQNKEEEELLKENFLDVFFKPKAPLVKLKDTLIEQKAINKAEILNILNSTQDKLLPRISKIENIKKYIKTQNIIKTSSSRKLLVYGDAGIGKTSTLSSLQYFSPDDIVIIYDSFGAGTYKDDGEKRHKEKYIRIQIINEIAIRVGLNPYIENELYDLEEEFLRYIKIASKLLPNSKIIIIIDAADNNVEGAKTFNEDIFIPNLWSLNLPKNCYLIMSSRRYRKHFLEQTKEVEELELKGFDEDSSMKLLLNIFPFIDEKTFNEFYTKTKGNPRLQNYLLKNSNTDYKELQNILNNNEKLSLDIIFHDLWEQATAIIQPSTKKHLEELICLARPATIKNFSMASKLSIEDSLKVINILSPGITLKDNNQIGFLDEDFENFLLHKLKDDNRTEAYKRISKNLFEKITIDKYSAKNIALFLLNAKENNLLIDIALNIDLECIDDRLQRVDIEKDRVKKALNIAYQERKTKELLKLLYKATLLLKSNESLNEIIQNKNLDLLAIYTSNTNAIKILTKNQTNLGAFNYHCAYLIAKEKPLFALDYIDQGDIWLREQLKKQKKGRRDFDEIDIAKRIATIYYTKGLKRAFLSLKMWRLWFLFRIIDSFPKSFLSDLAKTITYEKYKIFLKKAPPYLQAIFLVILNKSCEHPIDNKIVKKVAKELYITIQKNTKNIKLENSNFNQRDDSYKISIDFIELAAINKVSPKILFSFLKISKEKEIISLHDSHSLSYNEDVIYTLILKSKFKNKKVNLDKFLENKIRATNDYDKERELEKTKSLINTLVPYYEFLIDVYTKKSSFKDIEEKWDNLTKKDLGYKYYSGNDTRIYSIRAKILAKILVITKANNKAFENLIKYCENLYSKKDVSEILLESGYLDYAFRIIESDVKRELKEASSSYDKLDFFVSYANLVKEYDLQRARYYFELAVESAHGLDDNAYHLYKIIASYSTFISDNINKKEKVELSNQHISLAETIEPYLYNMSSALSRLSFKTVAHLDMSISLDLSRRWHDSITYKMDDSVITLVNTFIKQKLLTPSEAFSFRYFIKETSVIDLFLNILNSTKKDTKILISFLEPMNDFIRKHLLSSEQYETSKKLLDWLEENGLSRHKISLEIKEFCKFYEEMKSQDNESSFLLENKSINWKEFYNSRQSDILSIFKEAISIGYSDIYKLLNYFEAKISPVDRIKCLNFLIKKYKQNYYSCEYGKALLYFIDKWEHDQNIRGSKTRLIKEFISNNYEKIGRASCRERVCMFV